MDPHNLATGMHNSFNQIKDPGNAGTISVDKSPSVCNLVSAGAETRTLARPTRKARSSLWHHRTDGGDITVTITGGYDEEGTTTFTFTDPGQFLMLQGFTTDYTTFYWRAVASHVTGILSAQMVASAADALLSGTLAATAAEINRAAKNSTRPVAAGAASLTVTQALHDGKTIMLDQATGVAVTLPAMSGIGRSLSIRLHSQTPRAGRRSSRRQARISSGGCTSTPIPGPARCSPRSLRQTLAALRSSPWTARQRAVARETGLKLRTWHLATVRCEGV
jgi:hypothetical protein